MSWLTDWLLGPHGAGLYLLVGLLVFAEDALFIGFLLPGETAAVLGGVAASRGHVALPVMMVVVAGAAIIGDSVGYEVGRRLGPRLLNTRLLRQRQRLAHDQQIALSRYRVQRFVTLPAARR
jgi:membrane-associated protein